MIGNRTDGYGEIVFLPAVEPLEAAVLPAKEKPLRGALHLAEKGWNPEERPGGRPGSIRESFPRSRT